MDDISKAEPGVYFLMLKDWPMDEINLYCEHMRLLGEQHGIKFIPVASGVEVRKASDAEFDRAVEASLRRIAAKTEVKPVHGIIVPR